MMASERNPCFKILRLFFQEFWYGYGILKVLSYQATKLVDLLKSPEDRKKYNGKHVDLYDLE